MTIIPSTWLIDYFVSFMLRSVPAFRRRLTFFDSGWLVVALALASSSARCANGSTFSEPPVPLYTKLEPMVAVKPVELEAPSSKRGFLKIEYCKGKTRFTRVYINCKFLYTTFSLRSLEVLRITPLAMLMPALRLMGDILDARYPMSGAFSR